MEKIIFIRNSPKNFGGIEKQILELAIFLYSNNILEPILVASSTDCTLKAKFEEKGFETFVVPIDKNIFLSTYKINNIVSKTRPKFIQTHMFKESVISRFIKFFNPSIINIFRVHVHVYSSWISFKKKLLYYFIDNLTSGFVDDYICISHNIMEELRKNSNLSDKKMTYIADAVSTSDNNIINDQMKTENIAMIANLNSHKGHIYLFEAINIIKKNYNLNVNIKLIGGENTGRKNGNKKSYKDILLKKADELSITDQVEMCGFVDDIFKEIEDVGVVVLPSEKEGTPNSLLEAMSMKKIVIASRVGGVPEFIINGVNGFLHNSKNSKELADLITHVIDLSDEKVDILKNNAYLTWEKNYKREKIFNAFANVYISYLS